MTTYLNILKSVFTILIFSTLLFSCPGETSEKEHNDSEQTEMNQDQEGEEIDKDGKDGKEIDKDGKDGEEIDKDGKENHDGHDGHDGHDAKVKQDQKEGEQ
jgi:hypothetical protein